MRNAVGKLATFAVATALAPALASAVTSVNLDFNGSGSTLLATGFDAAYNLNTAGFAVGGGRLTMQTLPGDTFGNYENDPDSAQNFFYSAIEPLGQTTVEARVRVSGLNQNFHGGGIWMGLDTDHYIRLALFNNTFEGGVAVEALRENQDFWPGNTPPGPGNDINARVIANIAPSPQVNPIDVVLRLVRTGNDAAAFASFDDGATFQQVGGAGFTFDGVVTGPGQGPNGGPSIEDGIFKVGVYALGGGTNLATFAFDSFSAVSVPEPAAAVATLALGLGACLRRRRG
jgi:hypothetical protein